MILAQHTGRIGVRTLSWEAGVLRVDIKNRTYASGGQVPHDRALLWCEHLKGGWIVYCDGAAPSKGGAGGVGYVAYHAGQLHSEGSLPLPSATNQQAEILAAAYALHQLPQDLNVLVYSDSEYVVNGWLWLPGWIERGWRTYSGSPVRNQRHWERLQAAVARHRDVGFAWVRGHAGTAGNVRADVLAGEARQQALAQAAA